MTDSKHPEKHPVADLPILQYKNEILHKIRNFPIVLITGETGCGKVSFSVYIKNILLIILFTLDNKSPSVHYGRSKDEK